ncbi:MAG: carbohydrate-binding domain-containing protein [Propionibacteriaceae bacterium]
MALAGGTITVMAADDGIRGKDYLVVTGGSFTVCTRAATGWTRTASQRSRAAPSLTGATKVTTVNVDTAAAGSMGGGRR